MTRKIVLYTPEELTLKGLNKELYTLSVKYLADGKKKPQPKGRKVDYERVSAEMVFEKSSELTKPYLDLLDYWFNSEANASVQKTDGFLLRYFEFVMGYLVLTQGLMEDEAMLSLVADVWCDTIAQLEDRAHDVGHQPTKDFARNLMESTLHRLMEIVEDSGKYPNWGMEHEQEL